MNDETELVLDADRIARLRAVVDELPEKIGDYIIESQLGEGGFGVVYRAKQLTPVKRTVAIKLLKRGMDSEAILRRFELERQALASMNHSGVAAVFDAGVSDEGQQYFVMEYVDGAPITQWANARRLGVRERLHLMTQVCDAITHAHQKGVIHRDIKPSNVLVADVDGAPQVKVIDFGVAKALDAGPMAMSFITQQSMLIGTPEYMSPEQASGERAPADTRTDVYSLGVLLYELLTGQSPFAASDLRGAPIDEVFRVIREQEPPRPSTRISRLDDSTIAEVASQRATEPGALVHLLRKELEWIPLKAIRKAPDERYQSPAEFRDDIERYLNDEPLEAGPEARSYRLRKFLYRRRWPVAAGAAILVSLVAGAIGTGVMAYRASTARDDALKQQGVAEDSAATTTAMNDFLVDLLRKATPGEARGKEIPVSKVVELALKDLDTQFAEKPRVRLHLRMVLSDILDELGRTPEAAEDLRRAAADAERRFGATDDLTLSLLNSLAGMESNLGNLERAAQVYQDLLERCVKKYGDNNRETLIVVNDLATTLVDLGQLDESVRLYRRAVAGREKLLGPHDYETLDSKVALASVLESKGSAEEALPIIESARREYEAHFQPDNVGRIHAVEMYASILWSLNRLNEAEPLYRDVLERRERIYGPNHPQTYNVLANLALVLENQGRADDAEPMLRRAYDGYRELFGPKHIKSIIMGNNLATALESLKRYDEAAEMYREVIAATQETLGEGHYIAIGVAQNLGSMRRIQGRLEEAEEVLLEAQTLAKKHLGPDHHQAQSIAEELAGVRAKLADEGSSANGESDTDE